MSLRLVLLVCAKLPKFIVMCFPVRCVLTCVYVCVLRARGSLYTIHTKKTQLCSSLVDPKAGCVCVCACVPIGVYFARLVTAQDAGKQSRDHRRCVLEHA